MESSMKPLGLALAATALQVVMVIAFAWPAAHIAPRDVPLVVAGPQASTLAHTLEERQPGAFDIKVRPDEAAARQALTDREAYGAIIATPTGPRVLVASAASPLIAQQLTQMLSGAKPVPVQDLVSADPDDPRGTAFGTMALPLIMSAIAGAVLFTFLLRPILGRLIGTLAFAVFGGLATTLVTQNWLSILPGPYWEIAGVTALAILTVTGTVAGLTAAIGRAGIPLGALTFLLLGNPLSAATSAPELLPQPWGEIGQILPPGAAVTLFRSVAFFDGANATTPLITLAAWTAAALVLFTIGGLRSTRTAPSREPVLA
jgi:hypothetical protein